MEENSAPKRQFVSLHHIADDGGALDWDTPKEESGNNELFDHQSRLQMKPLTREGRPTGPELRESLTNSRNFHHGMKSHIVGRANK